MNKEQFLIKLAQLLKPISNSEIDEAIEYYSEMIQDRIDEGINEEDAVNELGNIYEIANNIIAQSKRENKKLTEAEQIVIKANNTVETKKEKEPIKSSTIILLVLAFPFLFSFLAIVFSLLFAFYAVIWSLTFAYYVVMASSVFSGVASLFGCFGLIFKGEGIAALSALSVSFMGIGAFLILLVGAKPIFKFTLKISKDVFNKIVKVVKRW